MTNLDGNVLILIFILILVAYFVLKIISNIKLKKELKNNPSLQEKISVQTNNLFDKSKQKRNLILSLLMILFLTLLFLMSYMVVTKGLSYEYIMIIGSVGLIVFILVAYFMWQAREKNFKKFIESYLSEKYGQTKIIDRAKLDYINNDLNVRNNYTLTVKVLKYKCILNNYFIEYRKTTHNPDTHMRYYTYEQSRRIVEYMYNLSSYNKNIDSSIFENSKIKLIIEELSKTKFIEVNIKEDYVVISKTTTLDFYNKNVMKRDLDDIEWFYEKLINEIIKLLEEE